MTILIFRQVWGDLAHNKARTLLAMLSIAAGVFAVRLAAFGTPLDFSYSVTRVILWLTMVLTLSALASLWPALAAARVSVRKALAYE